LRQSIKLRKQNANKIYIFIASAPAMRKAQLIDNKMARVAVIAVLHSLLGNLFVQQQQQRRV